MRNPLAGRCLAVVLSLLYQMALPGASHAGAVLYVPDEEDPIGDRAVQRALEAAGFDVVRAASLPENLARYQAVVIIDGDAVWNESKRAREALANYTDQGGGIVMTQWVPAALVADRYNQFYGLQNGDVSAISDWFGASAVSVQYGGAG